MSAEPIPDQLDHECFFITPIGDPGSPERKRADDTLHAIVEPSADAVGLMTVRADTIDEGGHITLQILEHCAGAKVAVADLTGGNLNVYYEVGIRHALSQPLVLIAEDSMRDALPFDLLQQRTIFYADTLEGAASARAAVTRQLERALAGSIDSPVPAATCRRGPRQGDALQQTLARLVSELAELPTALERTATAGKRSLPRHAPGGSAANVGAQRVPLTQIRYLRVASGLTQEQMAHRSGLDRTEVSAIERGRVSVRLASAARMADALGVDLSELVGLA